MNTSAFMKETFKICFNKTNRTETLPLPDRNEAVRVQFSSQVISYVSCQQLRVPIQSEMECEFWRIFFTLSRKILGVLLLASLLVKICSTFELQDISDLAVIFQHFTDL